MFADKVREYIASNRALQMWHRLNDSEIDILKDFAAWLDENAVEQRVQPTPPTEPQNFCNSVNGVHASWCTGHNTAGG